MFILAKTMHIMLGDQFDSSQLSTCCGTGYAIYTYEFLGLNLLTFTSMLMGNLRSKV